MKNILLQIAIVFLGITNSHYSAADVDRLIATPTTPSNGLVEPKDLDHATANIDQVIVSTDIDSFHQRKSKKSNDGNANAGGVVIGPRATVMGSIIIMDNQITSRSKR